MRRFGALQEGQKGSKEILKASKCDQQARKVKQVQKSSLAVSGRIKNPKAGGEQPGVHGTPVGVDGVGKIPSKVRGRNVQIVVSIRGDGKTVRPCLTKSENGCRYPEEAAD